LHPLEPAALEDLVVVVRLAVRRELELRSDLRLGGARMMMAMLWVDALA